jgi:hypothetical protein
MIFKGPGSYGLPDEKLEFKRKNKTGKVQLLDRSKGSRMLPMVGSEVILFFSAFKTKSSFF